MKADRVTRISLSLVTATLAMAASARVAHAQVPSCGDATMFPNPIYLAGSSAFQPYAQRLAPYLAAASQTTKYTILYNGTASLDGPTKVKDGVDLTGMANYFPGTAGAAGTATPCAIPAGTKADIGISDVAWDAFPQNAGTPLPATVGEFLGPVQAMELVVPEDNTTITALSAEQAAAIWGCGPTGMVGMFTDNNGAGIQQRDMNSGTQLMISKYIGLPAMFPFGTTNASTGNLLTSLGMVANHQAAIGFVSADNYDSRRSTLNAVAFKGIGQTHAYYADSTAASFDKRNVRDGHYLIQGPVHFFTKVDGSGAAMGVARQFIEWVQGKTPFVTGSPLTYIDIAATAGTVPLCAMSVTRDSDGGFLKAYHPAVTCNCYFESKVGTGTTPTSCLACTDSTSCTGGKTCQSNFCE